MSLVEKPHVFVSFGIDEISEILKLLLIFKLSFSKPFWNNSNYASFGNIREVMKFYNLGDKSFDTHLRKHMSIKHNGFSKKVGKQPKYPLEKVPPKNIPLTRNYLFL